MVTSGDGGVNCVAYDPTPIRGGKYVIQAKLYDKTVPPTAVRDLYGTRAHEGAKSGILITTSGYGPSRPTASSDVPDSPAGESPAGESGRDLVLHEQVLRRHIGRAAVGAAPGDDQVV
ncbi:restriction endonuclease [Dactylosporangium sp. NPDC000521]|uniref:restriction endonuclease n=1 Tax=Dactylosporangium sp. NPDC000521 TaxID=3363975 RepID=UPI003681EAFE